MWLLSVCVGQYGAACQLGTGMHKTKAGEMVAAKATDGGGEGGGGRGNGAHERIATACCHFDTYAELAESGI